MPSVRTVVRTLIAALLIAAPLLVAFEVPAVAQVGNPVSGTDQAASHALTLSIDSVSPEWAQPGKRITVHGTVTNNTGSPVSGLQIAIQTESTAAFGNRSAMETYAAGGAVSSAYLATTPVGTPYTLPGTFHSGTKLSWSVSFPASEAGYTQFGVYPLAAVMYNSSLAPIGTDRTLLPYWPGSSSANPVRISWIWPLVDQPQQGPCPQTLAGTEPAGKGLATSLQPSGRLGRLLSSGLKLAGQADLTWAVDPALLSDAATMSAPYKVGGTGGCTGATGKPASKAAATWLSTLKTEAAGEPMFITPYADVDVAALAHAGMTTDLQSAYTLGEKVANQSLERRFGQNGNGTGDGGAPSVAWPAGGTADEGTATALADTGKINTIVLGTNEEPSATSTVIKTTTGAGTPMRVLLADSGLTDLLGTSTANSSAGAQFATEQDFLAETAMIVAELPFGQGRSIIVAPPRRWSPSTTEANALLSESSAPWLRPAKLSDVASSTAEPGQLPSNQRSSAELSSTYMNLAKAVGQSLGTYQNLLYQPNSATTQSLRAALAATESTAWRGSGNGAGTAALIGLANFVRESEQKVQIIAGKKFLLAGASGDIAVSVRNGLSQAVQVRVHAALSDVGQLSIGTPDTLMTVPGGKTGTVKMPVHATGIETTTMQLQLVTRNGWPLPQSQVQTLTVQVTRYGRALIILIVAALGVVVLASGARWVRQWLNDTRAGSGGTG
jgi:hypothetical protein